MVSDLKGEGEKMVEFNNFKIKGFFSKVKNYPMNFTCFEHLIDKSIDLCFFHMHPDGGELISLPTKKKLNELAIKINELAELGFNNSKDMHLALEVSKLLGGKKIEFNELPIGEWALHGIKKNNRFGLNESQVIGFSALMEIDKLLDKLTNGEKIDAKTLEAVMHISLSIQAGYEIKYSFFAQSFLPNEDAIQKIQNSAIRNYTEELNRKKSHVAAERAKIKHEKDPRQAEKSFIVERWRDWQGGKTNYDSAAAFALDMLEKVSALKSTKVIERWCTELKKGKSI